jgi:hypothetical protein
MGFNELERQAVLDSQGPNPIYPTQQKGIVIPADTTLEDYIDTVSGGGFVKDSDLQNANIDIDVNTVTTNAVYASTVEASSNGAGENFKVGDDAYIGDVNKTNTICVSGIVNGDRGFIQFGSGSQPSIGHNGSGGFPAVGSTQAITGSILTKSGHLYFFNGGVSNNGWSQII